MKVSLKKIQMINQKDPPAGFYINTAYWPTGAYELWVDGTDANGSPVTVRHGWIACSEFGDHALDKVREWLTRVGVTCAD